MNYVIGIDGGGTKTEIVVCASDGTVAARAVGGSSNPNDIGNEKMIAVIEDLIRRTLPPDCTCADVGLGISGLATAGSEDLLRNALVARFPILRTIRAYSDKDSALYAAHDGDGCIVIVGTGCVGVMKKGDTVRDFGGGGYLVDDTLSGFDLGKAVLAAVLADTDGFGQKTLLSDLFFQKTGEGIRKHLKVVYQKGKAYVASFAPLLFAAREKGDATAEAILQKAVRNFEPLVLAMHKAWGAPTCEVTLFGGVARDFAVIEPYFSAEVREKISFKAPEKPIIYGLLKEFIPGDRAAFAQVFAASYAAAKA